MAMPEVTLPLNEFTKSVAREAAHEVMRDAIQSHVAGCPGVNTIPTLTQRVEAVENKMSKLIGFMIGSGVLGGSLGALLAKLLSNFPGK